MKHCENLEQKLSAYLDGELSDTEYDEIEAHLDSCTGCKGYFQELESAQNILRENVPFDLPSGVDKDRMWANIESQIEIPQPSIWQRIKEKLAAPTVWVPTLAATAAAVMLFFVSTSLQNTTPVQTAKNDQPVVQEQQASIEPNPPEPAQLSRVESVSSQSGQVMVLQTASSNQPIVWFVPSPQKEEAKS